MRREESIIFVSVSHEWIKEAPGYFYHRGQTREIALRVCGHMEVPGILYKTPVLYTHASGSAS